MVNNYYKAGPGTSNKTRVTQVSVSDANNGGDNPFPGYASRYYISGNYVTAAGSKAANYDWQGVIYDNGLSEKNGDKYIPDAAHRYGDPSVINYENIGGTDCVKLKLDSPIECGDVTTHSAETAYEKLLAYCGASLYRDDVDVRNMDEARNGTTTYNGDVALVKDGVTYKTSNTKGILDFINDPTSSTVEPKTASFPELNGEKRPAGFDSDEDGIPDEWETANGLNPNDKSDANLFTLDPKGWYSNIEVYINSLVEHIIKAQNADAISAVDEYFPSFTSTGITAPTVNSDVAKIEYFTLDGRKVSEPATGVNIRKITYSNGKVTADKVIKN